MLEFIDPYELDPDLGEPGRRWHAAEIRLKSNEDLQKLWVVLMKERNMLHTTKHYHRKRGTRMPHASRLKAVRTSMAMINVVLGERQREKVSRDADLHAERQRESALAQLDLAGSVVWPPWVPGSARELPLAAEVSFNVILRTGDGAPPVARPPPDALSLTLLHDGVAVADHLLDTDVVLRPAAPSRPDELSYVCRVLLQGDAVPRERFLLQPHELGEPVLAHLNATLYGEEIGGGPVPLLLLPSKRLRRRAKMAEINLEMASRLRDARDNAAASGL
jgi:hypothetical protein